jgi:hypothetical protein
VEKLAILEGRITPTNVKKGLNAQQKSVPQLPALFKPKTQKILGGNANEKNPMAGYAVGGCEESVNEAEMSEDVLEKVKRSFTDFIKHIEDEINDSDLKDKKKEDSGIKKKDNKDRDLIVKVAPVAEDPTDSEEDWYDADGRPNEHGAYDAAGHYHADREDQDAGYDAYKERQMTDESSPVKTVTNECGLWEMHGNERDGFEVRRSGRSLPTRFRNLEQAEMALEMFLKNRAHQEDSQDYLDEE